MNLMHMKYAVVVAETQSINKAADQLYVGQSALSRAIKELESGLGVVLFRRSAKGMFLTPDGELFVRNARKVLAQVDAMENLFSAGKSRKKQFSVSVPRASYVAKAFAAFAGSLDRSVEADIYYRETNALRAIRNILQEDYRLGVIRYAESYDKYYKALMEDKGLCWEVIARFRYVLLMNEKNPLAKKPKITYADLHDHTEIAHADPYVPSLPAAEVKKDELPEDFPRRIFVFERASQFELLTTNTDAFMWVSPVPQETLARFGLVQRACADMQREYTDLLICRKEYRFTDLDNRFIEQLKATKREILGE